MVSTRKFNNAVKCYNDLMEGIGLEHLTIGMSYSEEQEAKKLWNLRDLVAEADYQLGLYYQDTEQNRELKGYYGDDVRESAKETIKDLKAFIRKYQKDAATLQCNDMHCSLWG